MTHSNAPISFPLHTTINIVGFCNLNCVYCYAQPFSGEYIPIEALKCLLEELHTKGVFSIKIGGGEPFLHPNIFEILMFIASKNIPVAILSNGTRPEKSKLPELSTLLLENRFINYQITLDSIIPEEHNITRGRASETIETIEYMSSAGVDVQVATVVSSININSIDKLVASLFPSVRKFHFMNIMNTARALPSYNQLVLSKEDLLAFWMQTIPRLKSQYGSELKLTCDEYLRLNKPTSNTLYSAPGCFAAHTFVDINSNMDVLACNCANQVRLGNLKEASLEEIWNSQLASDVRRLKIPPCQLTEQLNAYDNINSFLNENQHLLAPESVATSA